MSSDVKPTSYSSTWIVDSTIPEHICCEKSEFQILEDTEDSMHEEFKQKYSITGPAKGIVQLQLLSGPIIAIEALYVPGHRTSHLSVKKLVQVAPVTFIDNQVLFGIEVIGGLGGLGQIRRSPVPHLSASFSVLPPIASVPGPQFLGFPHTALPMISPTVPQPDFHMWQYDIESLGGHLGDPGASADHNDAAQFYDTAVYCPECSTVNNHKAPLPAVHPLQLVHSIIGGPMPVASLEGARYFVLYIDDYSRFAWVYFIPSTTPVDLVSTFNKFNTHVRDKLPEFTMSLFQGDSMDFSTGYFRAAVTASGALNLGMGNGPGKSMVNMLCKTAHEMMVDSKLGDQFWAEALQTAVYVYGSIPLLEMGSKSPFEMISGRLPETSHLRRFGCAAYVSELTHGVGGPRMCEKECVMLGYMAAPVSEWIIWDPRTSESKTVLIARFDEEKAMGQRDDETKVFGAFISANMTPLVGCKDGCKGNGGKKGRYRGYGGKRGEEEKEAMEVEKKEVKEESDSG